MFTIRNRSWFYLEKNGLVKWKEIFDRCSVRALNYTEESKYLNFGTYFVCLTLKINHADMEF